VSDADCPRISILLAARDEEEKLPAALATLMEINYPNLEVVAVDDRSKDATGRILDEFAATHSRLRVVHVAQLPAGWLGKPHALQEAYEAATGEWLLFTDADVRFKADVLRRAVAFARQQSLDHLSLLCDVEMVGFWEKALITFFVAVFHLATNPRLVGNHGSPFYVGIGAFQLLKRSTYEACGTHRRLAMEVIDDMKLGKVVKRSGFHSGVVIAQDSVVVRWHDGIGNLTRGVTKNFLRCLRIRSGLCGRRNQQPPATQRGAFPRHYLRSRLDTYFRRHRIGYRLVLLWRDGRQHARVAALLPDVSVRCHPLELYAPSLRRRYTQAGRHRLARHVLSAG